MSEAPASQPVTEKSRRSRLAGGLAALLLVLALLPAAVSSLLTWAVRSYALPTVAELLHTPHLQCDVRRVGITGLDLADIRLDKDAPPSIGSIRVSWNPAYLLLGRITNLAISDLHLVLCRTDSGWHIPGLPAPQENATSAAEYSLVLPQIDHISVSGQLELQQPGHTSFFPLTVTGIMQHSAITLRTDILAAGQRLQCTLNADLQTRALHMKLLLPPASLGALTSLTPLEIPRLNGTVLLAANADMTSLDSPTVNASVELSSTQTQPGIIPLDLQTLSAQAQLQDNIITMSHLHARMAAPLPLTIYVHDLQADLHAGRMACAWNVTVEELPDGTPLGTPASPLLLSGRTAMQLQPSGWTAATNASSTTCVLRDSDNNVLQINNATMTLYAAATDADLAVNGTIRIPKIEISLPGQSCSQQNIAADVTAVFADNQINAHALVQGDTLTMTSAAGVASCGSIATDMTITNSTLFHGRLTAGSLQAGADKLQASLPKLLLDIHARHTPTGTSGTYSLETTGLRLQRSTANLRTTQASARGTFALAPKLQLDGEMHLKASGTSGNLSAAADLQLPFAWPQPAQHKGRLHVTASQKKKRLAAVVATLTPSATGYTVSGTATVLPLSVRAALGGQLDLLSPERSVFSLSADQQFELSGSLPQFIPAAEGTTGGGRLTASAKLHMDHGAPVFPVSLALQDISLSHEQSTARLSDGALRLDFADLLTSRSQPEQQLTFSRLELGSVLIENGDIRFQIDAPQSILVEGCDFRWAGGRIGTQAFRINPDIQDYKVVLYCDRVEMAQALEQFGLSQAQGGGRANGRIPVRYKSGSLTFDDGFLYSTPGEKGVLRVQGTEVLTAGIPPDSAQYAQLDLAAEALKEFSYDWARIRLQTDRQDLVVSLEMDGKPLKPLPFVYQRDFGGFARVDASSPGSVFQGIRLDANFRLPLDQLLHYRQILQLMNNGG